MKLTIDDVKTILKDNEPKIRKLGVKEIYLFGSVVRGEAKETSDVDFLIVFEPTYPASFFTLYDLEQLLTEKLKTRVDLGTKLHPMLKDQIMREALRVA